MPRSRIRIILIFIGILILAAWGLFFNPSSANAPVAGATFPPPPQVTLTPPTLEELALQYPRLEKLLRDPNVDSAYKDFVVAYERGGLEAAEELARTRGLLTPDNHIRVTLVVDTADTGRLIADLQAQGINVLGAYQDLIDISIPLDVITRAAQSDNPAAVFENIRDLEHVVGLQFSPPTTPSRSTHSPPLVQTMLQAYVSEGLSVIQADQWQAAGFTGRGVQIGILDQGFDGYRALLGSELPAQIEIRSFVPGIEPDATGESHGTAVAEILHDIAPDAKLFLAYYDGGDVSMGNAVEWLIGQGAQIISHSAGGLAGPMDGGGRDAELVNRAAAEGVLWINSAGNSASEHYRGVFTDADGDDFHDFDAGNSLLAFRPAPGNLTQIVLNWNDWPVTSEDYDLYLLDREGVVLASSRNVQSGQRAPVEQIVYRFDDQGVYYVAVQTVNTTRAARLDLYIHEARSMEHTSPSSSLATPGDARGALTVGAAHIQDGRLESFSSYGPTEDGRPKPELIGPDGVSVSVYAPEAFFGTSAAAPHIAGAAALAWSAFPELDASEVRAFLLANTIAVPGDPPADAVGEGALRLPTPPNLIGASPRPTLVPISRPTSAPDSSNEAWIAVGILVVSGAATASALALRRRRSGKLHFEWRATRAIACTVCGAQVRSDAQFCPQCGRPVDPAARRACAACGESLRPGASFCANCGAAA